MRIESQSPDVLERAHVHQAAEGGFPVVVFQPAVAMTNAPKQQHWPDIYFVVVPRLSGGASDDGKAASDEGHCGDCGYERRDLLRADLLAIFFENMAT